MKATALCNLGATLIELQQNIEALELLQQALDIYRQIGSRPKEVITLYNLAELYHKLHDDKLAHDFYKQGLSIAQELGIFLKESQELKEKLFNTYLQEIDEKDTRYLIKLPLEERRKILAKQAEKMCEYYQQDREWEDLQTWDELYEE